MFKRGKLTPVLGTVRLSSARSMPYLISHRKLPSASVSQLGPIWNLRFCRRKRTEGVHHPFRCQLRPEWWEEPQVAKIHARLTPADDLAGRAYTPHAHKRYLPERAYGLRHAIVVGVPSTIESTQESSSMYWYLLHLPQVRMSITRINTFKLSGHQRTLKLPLSFCVHIADWARCRSFRALSSTS